MKFLIVDNSRFMRGTLKNILVRNGFEQAQVIEAEDGEDALAKFKEEKPDLVFLDIIMPKKDGMGVLEEIGNTAKVIIVSAVGQQSFIDEAKLIGAKDFIVKPFEAQKVVETVKRVLGSPN